MKKSTTIFAVLLFTIIAVVLLEGCSPSVTKDDAEKEIISFWLDRHIRLSEKTMGDPVSYSQTRGEPWLDKPEEAMLIIYFPPNVSSKKVWDQLKTDEPIKVWWYYDHKLVEATDSNKAIQKYKEQFSSGSRKWLRYEFGILSLSANNRKATIYERSSFSRDLENSKLYEEGRRYKVRRNGSGNWDVIDSEGLWLSYAPNEYMIKYVLLCPKFHQKAL